MPPPNINPPGGKGFVPSSASPSDPKKGHLGGYDAQNIQSPSGRAGKEPPQVPTRKRDILYNYTVGLFTGPKTSPSVSSQPPSRSTPPPVDVDLQAAIEASKSTHADEEARRQSGSPSSSPVPSRKPPPVPFSPQAVAQHISPPSRPAPLPPPSDEDADLAAAIAASLADQNKPASASLSSLSQPLSDAASDKDFAKILAESAAADAGKNAAAAQQRAAFSTAIANSLPVYGLTLQKAKDDGDCFYHALCDQLKSEDYPDPQTLRFTFDSFVDAFVQDPSKCFEANTLVQSNFYDGGDALVDLKTAHANNTISQLATASGGKTGWAPIEYAPLMAAFLQRPVLVFSPQNTDNKGQLIPIRYMLDSEGKVALPNSGAEGHEAIALQAALFADTSIPNNALILVYNGTDHWDAAFRT